MVATAPGAKVPLGLKLLAVVAAVLLTMRLAILGVYRHDTQVRIRDWFRTRTFDATAIKEFRAVSYSGYANRFSSSNLFLMIAIVLNSGEARAVRSSVGSALHVKAVAARLTEDVRGRRDETLSDDVDAS